MAKRKELTAAEYANTPEGKRALSAWRSRLIETMQPLGDALGRLIPHYDPKHHTYERIVLEVRKATGLTRDEFEAVFGLTEVTRYIDAAADMKTESLAVIRQAVQDAIGNSDPQAPRAGTRGYRALQVLWESEAYDAGTILTTATIVRRADGPDAASSGWKNIIATLKTAGVVATGKGRSGGVYLTPRGREVCAKLFAPHP